MCSHYTNKEILDVFDRLGWMLINKCCYECNIDNVQYLELKLAKDILQQVSNLKSKSSYYNQNGHQNQIEQGDALHRRDISSICWYCAYSAGTHIENPSELSEPSEVCKVNEECDKHFNDNDIDFIRITLALTSHKHLLQLLLLFLTYNKSYREIYGGGGVVVFKFNLYECSAYLFVFIMNGIRFNLNSCF